MIEGCGPRSGPGSQPSCKPPIYISAGISIRWSPSALISRALELRCRQQKRETPAHAFAIARFHDRSKRDDTTSHAALPFLRQIFWMYFQASLLRRGSISRIHIAFAFSFYRIKYIANLYLFGDAFIYKRDEKKKNRLYEYIYMIIFVWLYLYIIFIW